MRRAPRRALRPAGAEALMGLACSDAERQGFGEFAYPDGHHLRFNARLTCEEAWEEQFIGRLAGWG
eukprot:gene51098-37351_t